MESSFTILRVRGIPIGANWGWLAIFGLVTWSLQSQILPRTYPGLESGTYVAMALVAAVVFFASLIAHELGHAFRALKEGMEIEGITLWILGGVAKFKGMFPSAGAEFRIAIAGPVVTAVLTVVFWAVTVIGHALRWPDAVVGVADYEFRINFILLAFNLIPAFPLDGGRVLRSWLWKRERSFVAATFDAARAGQAFGAVLIGLGILSVITGAGLGSLWLVFIGWFIRQAGQAEVQYALVTQSLRGLVVQDLMTPRPTVVEAGLTLDGFLEEVARLRGHSTYPVLDDGRLAGLVSIRLAGAVPPADRARQLVRDVMLPLDQVPVVGPDDPVADVLLRLQQGPGRAFVVRDGELAGILSMSDVARALEIAQTRGAAPAVRGRRSAWIAWIVTAVAAVVLVGLVYTPPVVVLAPGISVDVTRDIRIRDAEVDEVRGRYLLTSVQLSQPNGAGLALAWLRGRQVIPVSDVIPRGADVEQYIEEQRSLFRESERVAAAAAARAAGLDVRVTGGGARVVAVAPGSPAAEALEERDVVTAVDGRPVRLVSDLVAAVSTRPPGTRFELRVVRAGRPTTVRVRSDVLEGVEGRTGLGVVVETVDLDVDLPFQVSFRERDIGGPSAGLAYALAIYDLLDPADVARGRAVAATGTIDIDGRVGPVGGVDAKAEAAQAAGADLFLVPEAEVGQARGEGIPVRGVGALEDAIEALGGSVRAES